MTSGRRGDGLLRVLFFLLLLLLLGTAGQCSHPANTTTSRSTSRSMRAKEVDAQPSPLVVFQFLDESFLPIWHNWIAIALHFQVFDGATEYYLSCFGSPLLNDRVKLLYPRGCTSHRIATPETYKRIYLAKWTALVDAFLSSKKDMLLIDLDAILLKSPRTIYSASSSLTSTATLIYDIISSTDHGHTRRQFPYSHNWGNIRLCTGFIWFRYSEDMADLLQTVLAYQSEFGQGDQIAFNNVLAQFGVVWEQEQSSPVALPPHIAQQKSNNPYSFRYAVRTGALLWFNQEVNTSTDVKSKPKHKYVSDFASQRSSVVNEAKVTRRLQIKLLPHHTVMRYCDKKGDATYDVIPHQYTALHCFDSRRVPSAGFKRAHLKAYTFQAMALWVLKWQYTPSYSHALQQPGSFQQQIEQQEKKQPHAGQLNHASSSMRSEKHAKQRLEGRGKGRGGGRKKQQRRQRIPSKYRSPGDITTITNNNYNALSLGRQLSYSSPTHATSVLVSGRRTSITETTARETAFDLKVVDSLVNHTKLSHMKRFWLGI